jgi:hypothetical protein
VRRSLRPLTAAIFGLLCGQFLLGMVSNFYAQLPKDVPGVHGNFDSKLGAAARWALLHGPSELQAHVAFGLAIGVSTIVLAGLSLRVRERPWNFLAPIGLIVTAWTGLAGAAFLAYHEDDLYSLLMSLGFLTDFLLYGGLLYLSRAGARAPTIDARPVTRLLSPPADVPEPHELDVSPLDGRR